jgi:hypothetical protein
MMMDVESDVIDVALMATQQEIRLVETSGFNEPLAFLNRFINSK